ncbi:MAG: hypothetical protein R3321_11260 [Nitrososphaeraceae archaeon]|nr:hypothetical protein [Nitrososphaeraceae archaeon]
MCNTAIVSINLSNVNSALITIFLGNLFTTIEAARTMLESGMKRSKIFKKWFSVSIGVLFSILLGYLLINFISLNHASIILGFPAGALLAMITESLIPESYQGARYSIGLSMSLGFILGYILFHF